MVWYSHVLKNFPLFVVVHTVKVFHLVNKAEVDVFLEFSCFFYDPTNIDNLISDSSAFSKSSLNIWKFSAHMLLKPHLTNRFKRLDLIDRVPKELWTEVCDTVQQAVIKTIPKIKKCKKAKWLSEEVLHIAMKRREVKGKGEKERCTHLNAEFQRIERRQ